MTDVSLYQKILDWKKVASDKLTEFTPDEQEVVDYILSFIHDADERDYTMHHLRRFVATLQRIPPPQRSTDRLLELGSLLHLAPAIKKFCGYQEVYGADFWESEEKVTQETLQNEIESYELTMAMYQHDTTTLLSLRQAESTVDAARASLAQYERQLAEDTHALTLVLGQAHSDARFTVAFLLIAAAAAAGALLTAAPRRRP